MLCCPALHTLHLAVQWQESGQAPMPCVPRRCLRTSSNPLLCAYTVDVTA